MRIGLIALSGVRVRTAELAALGVTLPGFVRRGRVIAALPSLHFGWNLLVALVLACDEGRLLTDLDTGPFDALISAPTGPDTVRVGATATFSTTVQLGDATVTDSVVVWSATPEGRVALIRTGNPFTVNVRGQVPDSVTLTARIEHPDLKPIERTRSIAVTLLHVEAARPVGGDTVITALEDTITIRARGVRRNRGTPAGSGHRARP